MAFQYTVKCRNFLRVGLRSKMLACRGLRPGNKKYTPPPRKPSFFPFSGSEASMVYTLLSGPMVYTLFPCFPRKMVYNIAFLLCDLGVGRQTEKRGVPRWWCIVFFPLCVCPYGHPGTIRTDIPGLVAPYCALSQDYLSDTALSRAMVLWVSQHEEFGSDTLPPYPKGPKIEKIQDRPPGLKFSIEIEKFKRATQQTPIFLWGILKVRIEIFNRD